MGSVNSPKKSGGISKNGTVSSSKKPPSQKNTWPPWLILAVLASVLGFLATKLNLGFLENSKSPTALKLKRWYDDREIVRRTHAMGGQVYSYNPLVVYVPNFVNKTEVTYLAEMGERLASPSLVLGSQGEEQYVDSETRSSKSAVLPFMDPVVFGVADRSQRFQGYNDISHLESLQVVSYGKSDYFMHHYDYITNGDTFDANGGNRDTTMLVYLEDNCTGGGTNFPQLPLPTGDKMTPFWASVIDFNSSEAPSGVTFKPLSGAAIFWRNLDHTGKGFDEVLHAGLPVKGGRKSAINIWTGQFPVKGDCWYGIKCTADDGSIYDCLWDDAHARPGVNIQYSDDYWTKEGDAYRNLYKKADDLSARIKGLGYIGGNEEERKGLEVELKEIVDAMGETEKYLQGMLKTSKQPELKRLLKEVRVEMKKKR